MDGSVNTVVNGHANNVQVGPPSPDEIGREFVRRYYTAMCERPSELYRFYGHESFFRFSFGTAVQGQENIRQEIQRLGFENCKVRIYCVLGSGDPNVNRLGVQVCGELSVNGGNNRRFIQMFVLCAQTPKAFYVHNHLFIWADEAFLDNKLVENSQNTVIAEPSIDEAVTNTNVVSEDAVNGYRPMKHVEDEVQRGISTDWVGSNEGNLIAKSEATLPTELVSVGDRCLYELGDTEKKSPDMMTEAVAEMSMLSPPVEETRPKTWAQLVGSTNLSSNISAKASIPSTTKRTVAIRNQRIVDCGIRADAHSQPSALLNGGGSASFQQNRFNDDGCRLYIGDMLRTIMPQSVGAVEMEIKSIFEKFGAVASVNVPRRVFDGASPQGKVYAFIIMKMPQGAKNIFDAARQDRSTFYLKVKIDSLGFEGEATVSEQKSGSYRFSNPWRGSNRGTYVLRGRGRYIDSQRYSSSNANEQDRVRVGPNPNDQRVSSATANMKVTW